MEDRARESQFVKEQAFGLYPPSFWMMQRTILSTVSSFTSSSSAEGLKRLARKWEMSQLWGEYDLMAPWVMAIKSIPLPMCLHASGQKR